MNPPAPGEVCSLCRRVYPVQGEVGLSARQAALVKVAELLRGLDSREAIKRLREETGCAQDAATVAMRRARRTVAR